MPAGAFHFGPLTDIPMRSVNVIGPSGEAALTRMECRTGLGDWPETGLFLDSREQGKTA